MKRNFKRVLSIILCAVMLISIVPLSSVGLNLTAQAATALSGKCGANLTWNYNEATDTLTISGTGNMYDYEDDDMPWESPVNSTKKIVIEKGVTSIGDYAFWFFSSLTNITIPDSVTSICDSAFSFCSSLTKITIPNSVKSIGDFAFYACDNLADVYYNGTKVEWSKISIGSYNECLTNAAIHFESSSSEVSITGKCGDNLTWSFDETNGTLKISGNGEMDRYGFEDGDVSAPWYDYINLIKTIEIGTGVMNIGDYAFEDCSSLTSITIPNSVKSIGDYVFSDCKSLASITIPNSVTSIGEDAFDGCISLTSITIPNSVTSIGWRAFYDCSSLTSVTIPNSVTSIGREAFSSCSSLANIKVSSGNKVYDSRNNCNAIIEAESNKLIAGCKNTIIPNSVTSIGSYAFCGCSSLTSITIPNSVTSIGGDVFNGCSSLASIKVSSDNKVYDSRNNCNAIIETEYNKLIAGCKNTVIPNSVTSIGYCAFSGCSSLTSITIPNSVTSIDNCAFEDCSSLTSITIPNSVTSIGDSAFEDCSSLTSITIPNSVTSIGGDVFFRCSSLKSITIPNSVTSIGEDSFYGCSSLTSITIPNSVMRIGGYAFSHCSSLTSITIPNSVTSISWCAFSYCSSLTSITIPNSVTSIGEDSFYGCSSLASVTIPNSVTSIGDSAFRNCNSLTSIIIPNSVTSISFGAFYDCDSLIDVYYNGTKSEWNKISIDDYNECLTNATIHYNSTGGATEPAIKTPSKTSINYGDSIVLHVDEAIIPAGGYVEWSANNGNFTYTVSDDGKTCTVTSKSSGKTTFTATVFDKKGKKVFSGTQEMTSKAGFFQKFAAFFKKLFGLLVTYPQSL